VGENPTAIKQEIERTRDEMGETIDAIGYKTDVRGRAEDYVSEKKDKVTGTASDVKDRVASTASRVVPSREGIKHQSQRIASTAQSNPVGMALGAAAAGFLVGMLVPSTRVEDEQVGGIADRMKEKVSDVGHEALERGREVAQEAKDSAVETMRERGREETKELASNLRDESQEHSQSGPSQPDAPQERISGQPS
jgi:ElaB/YqjD/DUF883 family membrane-anchored ribosome-binding protein